MSENKRQREELVENEPLDLTMGIRKSPVSILYGLKKARASVWYEEAVKSVSKKKRSVVKEDAGATYPIDLWFLIADYIAPETVGKFARICKDTLFVVDSAVFWIRLYKRFYQPGIYLNASLRPNTLTERFGLKTRVIRALHTMYKPLIIKRETSLKRPVIIGREIERQWFETNRSKTRYTYFFELRDTSYRRRSFPEVFEEYMDDIGMNPAEACTVLKITCIQQLRLPQLVGLRLLKAKIVRQQNKMLLLKCTLRKEDSGNVHIVEVELGPVIRTGFVNWWSPRYPHVIPVALDQYQFA